jgi:ubiquinone/menaquinone biosynthesis C-methylase UbiE
VLRFVMLSELAEMLARNGVNVTETRELTLGIAALVVGTKKPVV